MIQTIGVKVTLPEKTIAKEDKVEICIMLKLARTMWNRDGCKSRSIMTKDRDFCEFFGCNILVALDLWEMLVDTHLVPEEGCIEKILWSLMFLKVYAKERTTCSLAGGIDPKTFRSWVSKFVLAMANLESSVVSSI